MVAMLYSPPLTESSHYNERQTIVGGVNSEKPIAVSARKRAGRLATVSSVPLLYFGGIRQEATAAHEHAVVTR
jgi:hypothetical protein